MKTQKSILLVVFLFLISISVNAQSSEKDTSQTVQEFKKLDKLPSFPGGNQKMMEYLKNNIHYPDSSKKAGITGTVYVSFIVEENGKLSDIKINRGINEEINKEVIRVISAMPDWESGEINHKKVKAEMNMPVKFALQGNNETYEGKLDKYPAFPGGEKARIKYLKDNIKYPEAAKKSKIQGTVYVKFLINKDGSISESQILRGIGGGCDQEALRVINNMPKWSPAEKNGKPVDYYFTMPIKFKL